MISLETEAKDGAAALIFGALLMLHVLLVFLESVMTRPRMSVEEAALVKEIKGLTRQAIFFSTPSTFAKSAKLKRAAVQKEKELAELRRKVKHEVHWWSYVSSSLPTLLKAGAYIFALWWFWLTPVATVPFQLISPFGNRITFVAFFACRVSRWWMVSMILRLMVKICRQVDFHEKLYSLIRLCPGQYRSLAGTVLAGQHFCIEKNMQEMRRSAGKYHKDKAGVPVAKKIYATLQHVFFIHQFKVPPAYLNGGCPYLAS